MEAEVWRENARGTLLLIRAVPRSSRDRVAGCNGGRLKVCVTAPPEKGRANERILKVISRHFGLPVSRLFLQSGDSAREKTVLLDGMTVDQVKEKIDGIA